MSLFGGVRVCELSDGSMATCMTGYLMGMHGATVLKLEKRHRGGDSLRIHAPLDSTAFPYLNRNKRSANVKNLSYKSGKEKVYKILENTDVFLTSYPVWLLQFWKLTYDDLYEKFPKLIYVHISAGGSHVPNAQHLGHKPGQLGETLGFWCGSGLGWQFERSQMGTPIGMGEAVTSSLAMGGISMALVRVMKSGNGQLVETSALQAGLWANSLQLSHEANAPEQIEGGYHQSKEVIPTDWELWPTQDGLVSFEVKGTVPKDTKKALSKLISSCSSEHAAQLLRDSLVEMGEKGRVEAIPLIRHQEEEAGKKHQKRANYDMHLKTVFAPMQFSADLLVNTVVAGPHLCCHHLAWPDVNPLSVPEKTAQMPWKTKVLEKEHVLIISKKQSLRAAGNLLANAGAQVIELEVEAMSKVLESGEGPEVHAEAFLRAGKRVETLKWVKGMIDEDSLHPSLLLTDLSWPQIEELGLPGENFFKELKTSVVGMEGDYPFSDFWVSSGLLKYSLLSGCPPAEVPSLSPPSPPVGLDELTSASYVFMTCCMLLFYQENGGESSAKLTYTHCAQWSLVVPSLLSKRGYLPSSSPSSRLPLYAPIFRTRDEELIQVYLGCRRKFIKKFLFSLGGATGMAWYEGAIAGLLGRLVNVNVNSTLQPVLADIVLSAAQKKIKFLNSSEISEIFKKKEVAFSRILSLPEIPHNILTQSIMGFEEKSVTRVVPQRVRREVEGGYSSKETTIEGDEVQSTLRLRSRFSSSKDARSATQHWVEVSGDASRDNLKVVACPVRLSRDMKGIVPAC